MLGALFLGVWAAGGDFSLSFTTASPSSPAAGTKGVATSDVISIADQPAGDTVVIGSVTVPSPGVWAAVREVRGDDLGNVLGAAWVSGPRTDVSVQLLRATEPGLSYAIEFYRDDGGKTFDLAADSVYVDFATGAPVITYFTTTP